MHRQNNRHRNTVGGVTGFILLILGVVLFLGIYSGFYRFEFFPFPTIGIIIVILFLSGILRSRRRRVRQSSVHQYERRRSYQNEYEKREIYKPTENPFWKNQENDRVTTQNFEERVLINTNFCDYCGMKIIQEMKYCTNCGNKLI